MPKVWTEQSLKDVSMFVHFMPCESIFYFGDTTIQKQATMCIGVGRVKKIETGRHFDIITFNFGRKYDRTIIVKDNQARRQIFTLKHGQYAWFYGYRKMYFDKQRKVVFYAMALQGWYTPKNLDIKTIDPNELEIVKMGKETEKEISIIDKIIKEGI